MKNLTKLIAISAFTSLAAFAFSCGISGDSSAFLSAATPTPIPANAPANANVNANAAKPPGAGGKSITKNFILGKDSLDAVHGQVPFDHETHAFAKYSPDGTKVVGCVECHHTDQPKSAMKAPLVTSERDVSLTMEAWQTSTKKVSECRACHFQDGNVPDGKEMPVLNGKDLTNELAYHLNCNTCHDAAAKARPELKAKAGFATSDGKDCLKCHQKQN